MNERKNKVVWTTKDSNDQEVELAVLRPTPKVVGDAEIVRNRTWREAVDKKVMVRARLERVMREQGLWDDDKKTQLDGIEKRLRENELKLKAGGIRLADAKRLAFAMQDDRLERLRLLAQRNQLDQNTAEALADNARFNYLVATCTVLNKDGARYFADYDDYVARSGEEAAIEAARNMWTFLGLEQDFEKRLPENQFLLKYGFVDQKLRLVDKQGHLVDRDGRLVDKNGRYVNEHGEFIDIQGNRVDNDGNYVVEDAKPFLDDDDQPVATASPTEEVQETEPAEAAVAAEAV